MVSCLKMRKRITKEETHLMKNGSILLEELIASCDGKSNPIRTFSAKVLKKATNNYDKAQIIQRDIDYTLYKGYLEDHPVSVKKYNVPLGRQYFLGSPFLDIVIGSQMSAHNNVLKLIGCCLETQHPILVYEFVGSETLSCYISFGNEKQARLLSWKCRIKITADIASALAYLHTALSRPVIHRDISPENIILDLNFVAKLTDFSRSISIPDGQAHVEDVMIREKMGYVAPEICASGSLTEKVDVFSFGMFLLEVLTGRKFVYREAGDLNVLPNRVNDRIDNQQIIEIVHPSISRDDIEEQELQAIAKLAISCLSEEAEDRPTMTDTAQIPDGQSHVEDVVIRGKMGYMAPEICATGVLTEKVDVFCFGMFLLEVLTGRKFVYHEAGDVHVLPDRINDLIENQQIIEIVHPSISREDIEEQELQAIAKLALSCMSEEAEDRPTMTDLARELRRIQKHMHIPPRC